MKHVNDLFAVVTERLEQLARSNAVVAKPISIGDRHVIPLCELAVGLGAGGGIGEGDLGTAPAGDERATGIGGGAGGGAKAAPVAVLIIENGKARIEGLDR